ncbi:hypothetical protein Tco_1242713 [Tanacetum coccineum]
MIWPSRPDHDISLMIWPGRPNHDIEGWDLFSKKKGDSISSSKPFLEDAVSQLERKPIKLRKIGRSSALREIREIRRHGHYWPTVLADYIAHAKSCDACQSIVATAQPSPPSALGRSRASPECDFYGGDIHWVIPQKTTQAIGNGSYALPAEINPETVLPIARPMLTIEIGSSGFTPIPKFPN